MSAEDQTPIDNELSTLQAKIDKVEDKVEKLEAAEPNENKEEYARWDKKMEQLRTKEEQLRAEKILLLEMRKQQQAQQGDLTHAITDALGAIRVSQDAMRVSLNTVSENVQYTVREVLATNRRLHNPWIGDFLTTASNTSRTNDFRSNLVTTYNRGKPGSVIARCQLTNLAGAGGQDVAKTRGVPQVKAAHLIPRATKVDTLQRLDLNTLVVNSTRNGLILLGSVEEAYDKLRLSFVRNALGELDMKIWDPALRAERIAVSFDTRTFAYFEGKTLDVSSPQECTPYKRVLSYHAYIAHHHALTMKWIEEGTLPPQEFGTPEVRSPHRQSRLQEDQLAGEDVPLKLEFGGETSTP